MDLASNITTPLQSNLEFDSANLASNTSLPSDLNSPQRIESPPKVLDNDEVSLSNTAKDLNAADENQENEPKTKATDKGESSEKSKGTALSEGEQRVVQALKSRDAEVKAHERAHKSVGGQYTGAISYELQVGPDGKRYAIGGEVSIDASPVSGDPKATIQKLTIVKSAALAPAEPSTQDRSVAATASRIISLAQAEVSSENQNVESKEEGEKEASGSGSSSSSETNEVGVNGNAKASAAYSTVSQLKDGNDAAYFEQSIDIVS